MFDDGDTLDFNPKAVPVPEFVTVTLRLLTSPLDTVPKEMLEALSDKDGALTVPETVVAA